MWTDRTKLLVGQEGIDFLKKKRVAVIGIGGVGGYVCLMLARAGVGRITLVDFDRVDETNINRQVVANTETVGKFKTEVMQCMIEKINPNCVVDIFTQRFDSVFAEKFFSCENGKFDYVVDAIDCVQDKIDLICCCKTKNIKIVSAMGAGNRIDIPNFAVMDVFKTSNDGLAKVMRKKLRERKIESLDVVACQSPALKVTENKTGSIAFYPAMCGCVLSAFVINQFLRENKIF